MSVLLMLKASFSFIYILIELYNILILYWPEIRNIINNLNEYDILLYLYDTSNPGLFHNDTTFILSKSSSNNLDSTNNFSGPANADSPNEAHSPMDVDSPTEGNSPMDVNSSAESGNSTNESLGVQSNNMANAPSNNNDTIPKSEDEVQNTTNETQAQTEERIESYRLNTIARYFWDIISVENKEPPVESLTSNQIAEEKAEVNAIQNRIDSLPDGPSKQSIDDLLFTTSQNSKLKHYERSELYDRFNFVLGLQWNEHDDENSKNI